MAQHWAVGGEDMEVTDRKAGDSRPAVENT